MAVLSCWSDLAGDFVKERCRSLPTVVEPASFLITSHMDPARPTTERTYLDVQGSTHAANGLCDHLAVSRTWLNTFPFLVVS